MISLPKLKAVLGLVLATMVLTGCEFDVYKLPLPGGTDVGNNPITVHVLFEDVLDLVPKSTVKVNDVSVGQVTDIALDGQTADVTLELRGDTKLPDDAIAQIRQTSLLGEKFVSLSAPPDDTSPNLLATGDIIPLDRSGRNPEVEEVLGALSLVLNGGGVAQLKTIASELNLALDGREDSAKSVLTQIELLMSQLDDNKGNIVDAIDSLNRLSVSVTRQQGSIDSALEQLPSALTSLERQRNDLVKMLQSLNKLGGVGVRVIEASKAATIESFRQLQPVLTELANSGGAFVKAFNVFLTYPFVDEVVGRDPQVARNLHMGDYTNLSVQLVVDARGGSGTGVPTILPTIIDPTVILGNVLKCIASGDLTSRACLAVLGTAQGLANLRSECQRPRSRDTKVCQIINSVPGLPTPSGGGGGLPGLPSLPGLPGLPRSGFGPTATWSEKGPTMGQMMQIYDPNLVSLLVPGMVIR